MKRLYLILLILPFGFNAIGQQISREVIALGGGYFENDDLKVSYTLGQNFIETIYPGDKIITQGFQQPDQLGTSSIGFETIDSEFVKVFPNPTLDHINIEFKNTNNADVSVRVFNSAGKLTIKQNLGNSNLIDTRLPMVHLPAGEYLIQLIDFENRKVFNHLVTKLK